MRLDPVTTFLIVLVIGIVAGLVFDRLMGPGWFTRQLAGQNRHMLTSALIGTTQEVIDDARRCRDLGIEQLTYDFRTGQPAEMLAIIEHLATAVIPRID